MKYLLLLITLTAFAADPQNYTGPSDWNLEIIRGNVVGHQIVHKFGRNDAVGTSLVPLTSAGVYQTPTTAQSLELVSDSANDTAAGSGARTVEVIGLGSDWKDQSEIVTMNGTSAVALTNQFTRVHRMRVLTSGSYATQTTPSHTGTITLRGSGGGATWAEIDNIDGFGLGQSLIGAYSVPAGKKAIITGKNLLVDSSKTTTALFFVRKNIDQVTAPYDPMRVQLTIDAQTSAVSLNDDLPVIEGPADIGFLGKVSAGTSAIDVEFDILLY